MDIVTIWYLVGLVSVTGVSAATYYYVNRPRPDETLPPADEVPLSWEAVMPTEKGRSTDRRNGSRKPDHRRVGVKKRAFPQRSR